MKKSLGLFFFGTFALAIGIGCFSTTISNRNVTKAEAKDDKLVFVDGVATLGRYPQTITNVDTNLIKNNGTLDQETGWYTYQNKQYAIHTVQLDEEFVENQRFNDGSSAQNVNGSEKAFLVEDLKWEILEVGDGYADIITTRIIDRQIYSIFEIYYPITTIKEFNNTTFLNSAFTESEKTYLINFSEPEYTYKVNLPEMNQLLNYVDAKLEYPSDYAIASYLSANPEGGQTYINGPYWTRTMETRIVVFWSGTHTTGCLIGDPKIGVRPVIRVAYESAPVNPQSYTVSFDPNGGTGTMSDVSVTTEYYALPECSFNPPKGKEFSNWEVNKTSYKPGDKIKVDKNLTVIAIWSDKSSGGGGGSSSISSGGGGNVALGFGIAFTIIGAGGLIAFFVVWAKKHPSGKPPIWILASLAGSLVISVIGLGCLAGGIKGGSTKVVGWYQVSVADLGGTTKNLAINLTKDGKVYRYIGDVWEGTNFTYYRQPGVGTYTYHSGKLTVTAASEWKLQSWELPVTTYTDCNGLGSFIKYEGYTGSGYSWYHYSNVDSNGIEALKFSDTHDSGRLTW